MKVGGLLTMTFLGIFLGLLWFRKKSIEPITKNNGTFPHVGNY